MRELMSVKRFAKESPELYKVFKDYADNVFAVERNVKGKSFSAMSLDDKEKAINKMFAEEIARRSKVEVSAYDGDYAHYCENPIVKSFADSIFDRMIDMILPEALNTSVGLIAEIAYIDWGDTAKFDLDNNALYNVYKAGYRQKNGLFQQLEGQTVTVAPENRQVSLTFTLFEILTGRKSIAKEAMKAVRSIELEMVDEAWDAFTGAVSHANTPNELKVQNYTQATAVGLADKVTAWNGGKKAVFAGTPLSLSKIVPTDVNYRYTLDDDMVRLGYVKDFMTYDVIPTPNFADRKSTTYGLKLPDNKIYVVSPASDKIIKIAVGGSLTVPSGQFENANMSQTHTINKAWGIVCATNSICGQITLK